MPVVQHTLLQLDGVTPLIGRKCTVGQVGAALLGGTQTVDSLAVLTDATGKAQFTLAATVAGSYYVWTDPDGTLYTFTVPSAGSGPFNLTDLLVNTPAALPYTPVGSVGVSPQQLANAVAPLATTASVANTAAGLVSQLPHTGSYTYDGSGRVTADPDGNTYTYNSDDTIATVTRGGVTRTATYGANGVASWA